MCEGERTPVVPAADEATVLRYEPSRREILLGIDWPPMLWLAFILHLILVGFGLSSVISVLIATAMACLFGATFARFGSGTRLVVVDSQSITFRGLWRSSFALADIERGTLSRRGGWGPARLVLVMNAPKPKSFWRLDLTTRAVALPGNARFQAQITDAILGRRADLPVDEDAVRLLAGKLPVLLRHRLPILAAASVGILSLGFFLIVSYLRVYVAPWWYGVLVLPVFGVPSTQCLERESSTKRAIASLGVGAPAPLAMVSMVTVMYGGLEYVPVFLAAGLALAIGALVAALPRAPSAKTVAVGTATLLVALVGLTWHVTLADTIPVRELLLSPLPSDVGFSSGSQVVALGKTPPGSDWGWAGVHFVDLRTLDTTTVMLDEPMSSVDSITPLNHSHAFVSACLLRGHQDGLWIVNADGKSTHIAMTDSTFYIPKAVSTDGKMLAFCTLEFLPNETPSRTSNRRSATKFRVVDAGTGAALPASLRLERRWGAVYSLIWRRDGRLAWGEFEWDEEGDLKSRKGTLCLFSWAPGEDEPRTEYTSPNKWSGFRLSPRHEMALVQINDPEGSRSALVDLANGRMTDVPGVEFGWGLDSAVYWSEDASVYVFVTEAEPQTIRILRTETGEVSTLWRAPHGGVTSMLVSPDGRRVAFTVEQEHQRSIFIADTKTGNARRLRPMGTFMLSGLLAYSAAWSPDGQWLAIPAFGSRLALTASSGKGPLWLVSAEDM